jgi:hypothetical protein
MFVLISGLRGSWFGLLPAALFALLLLAPTGARADEQREQELERQLKEAQRKLAESEALRLKQEAALRALKEEAEKMRALLAAAETEVVRRQADLEKLRQALDQQTAENRALVKEKAALQDQAKAAEIQRKQIQDANLRLEQQLQELSRELARVRRDPGAVPPPGNRNPPAEQVEGFIKAAPDANGLVRLSIGSDAGLQRGHTLEVFRLSPNQARYLGVLKIVDVSPNEAVAQPVGKLQGPLQVGDRVASRIPGG